MENLHLLPKSWRMNAVITKVFLDEPRSRVAAFRYGFLAIVLVLAIFSAVVVVYLPPSFRGRYFGVIVPSMLLLNHLAFQFHWSRPVRISLRIAAIGYVCFALAYTASVMFPK